MRVLVTGATGRLGMNLVKTLNDRGYETISFCFDSPAEKELRERLEAFDTEIVLGNMASGDGIVEAVEKADAVVHTAALMQEDRAPSRVAFFDINTRGTFCLLEAIRDRSKPIHRLVAFTTGAVYDVFSQEGPYVEEQELWPLELYGAVKICNEQLYRLYHWQNDLGVIVLRPNLIVAGSEPVDIWSPQYPIGALKGNAGNPRSVLCSPVPEPWKLIEEALEGRPEGTMAVPYGPGRQSWKWHITDARDVVQAVLLSLETADPSAVGEVFNIASAEPQLWSEVVPYVAEKTGRECVDVDLPVSWNVEFDISKARDLLGYAPQYDVFQSIDTALEYMAGGEVDVLPPGIPH